MLRLFIFGAVFQAFFVFRAVAGELPAYDGPIFDAHVHYNREAWGEVSIEDVIAKWDAAGVSRSLVSSSPDDGTLKLLQAVPARVVAFFRPYRKSTHKGSWYKRPELLAYSEDRLSREIYLGLGEIHIIRPEHIKTPVVRRYLDMVIARGLFIQPHLDVAALELLLKTVPRLKVIWAHAGFDATAASVGALMDANPNVWADLSLRAKDIIGEEGLDPAWKNVLVRHAERFMIGTDTYMNKHWHEYEAIVANHRSWLSLLPRRVADKIAFLNAEKLFESGDN